MEWYDNPTAFLRWLDGKLQQRWDVTHLDPLGCPSKFTKEWRDVPIATRTTAERAPEEK